MKEYLLLLRDHEQRWDRFSPQEQQQVIERFNAWNAEMRAANGFGGAGKLSSDLGSTVRHDDSGFVVDGPFCDAKEAIAGYYCVRAESREAAEEFAKGCPVLTYGGSVEVRELVITMPGE
ncbi:MAG: transcription initiation protein [Alphaproteobacteria bacterium]|nr:transcription initiation protein [Alphaproteobacteria bacterium]